MKAKRSDHIFSYFNTELNVICLGLRGAWLPDLFSSYNLATVLRKCGPSQK